MPDTLHEVQGPAMIILPQPEFSHMPGIGRAQYRKQTARDDEPLFAEEGRDSIVSESAACTGHTSPIRKGPFMFTKHRPRKVRGRKCNAGIVVL